MLKKLILTVIMCATAGLAHADAWNVDKGGFVSKGTNAVIEGYDPVAYFTDNKAVKGDPAISSTYQGGTFHFVTADHKKQFEASPDKFAPQYGGYCAYAIGAKNQLVEVDPTAYKIVDGKLYLNYDKSIQKDWESKQAEYISKGDANWPTLKQK